MSRNVKLRPETEEAIQQSNSLLSELLQARETCRKFWADVKAAVDAHDASSLALANDSNPETLRRWHETYAKVRSFDGKSQGPNSYELSHGVRRSYDVALTLVRTDIGLLSEGDFES